MNIKKIFLPIFLFVGTIFAFIFSFKKNNILVVNSTFSDQKKINKTTQNPQQLQKLSVLPLSCIGCGKCARIDSSHFEMNRTTGKAIIISSTNLNSQNLTMAINNCPVQAITLN